VTGRARVETLQAIADQLGLTADVQYARAYLLRDSTGRVVATVRKADLPPPAAGVDALRRAMVAAVTDSWGD
jgi:hypothetical protein